MRDVIIRGYSVAACCSTHLLGRAGFAPRLERSSRPRLPAIMLSEAAVSLIRDVFGNPGLYRRAHPITRRVVKWGKNAEAAALDHSAVVVSEAELLRELENDSVTAIRNGASAPAGFTIYASRPLPQGTVEHCFGSRTASAAAVQLQDTRDSGTCWIESLENGWLFLIP